jgi:hypothetical protein
MPDDELHPRPPTAPAPWRALVPRVRLAINSAGAVVLGLAPHVLHHAGPLAGAALFAGVGGSLLFGALGLLLAIPLLLRLRRRFGTWRAPAVALALFVAVFSISTFVIGPALTGADEPEGAKATPVTPVPAAHEEHH